MSQKRNKSRMPQTAQLAPMDEESADLFRQLMKKMMEQTGKEAE